MVWSGRSKAFSGVRRNATPPGPLRIRRHHTGDDGPREVTGSLSLDDVSRRTRKHGLGGRSRNATISNGLICVVKTETDEPPSPISDAIIVGMVLVDADHGTFHSHKVIAQAIHAWTDFLASELGFDLRQEVDTWLPRKNADVVVRQGESKPTVPLGSVIEFEFPSDVTEQLVDDVKRRVDRT